MAPTAPVRKHIILIAVLLVPVALYAETRARNVVLFLADAGGISTITAASLHGYGAPRRLFIQRMPHIGLSDTTSATQIVSDSAAGMTAIVTGRKTHNGVIAQSATAVRGKQDGEPLKSILEYAEERGLSTGIVTSDSIAGATPAVLYAKSNDRAKTAEIFQQAFLARYGDGVDVMISGGRPSIAKALTAAGLDLDTLTREKGRPVLSSVADIAPDATRALVLHDSAAFDPGTAVQTAIRMLSRNRKGYFLMVEWDTHTDRIRQGLDRMVALDKVIEQTARTTGKNTLLLFTADHSFDLRLRGGLLSRPLLDGLEEAEAASPKGPIRIPTLRMDSGHTGEEVLVAAQGPGAQRVRGYMANTDLFTVMMGAFGWKPTAAPR